MRILFSILLFILSNYEMRSQVTMDTVRKYFTEQSHLVRKAREAKDYNRAEELDWQMIETIRSYPEEIKKKVSPIIGTLYYNIACYRSLTDRKKEAVKAFSEAVKYGWNNYTYSIKDHDLDNIRKEKHFISLMKKIQTEGDYLNILKQAGGYYNKGINFLPQFTYMPPNNRDLVRIRQYFNLDSIAGSGDEINKIKNLLHWVHNIVRHDGRSANPESKNAIDLIETCKKENRGINCRMMAIILNECYLAMGFKARYVICLPKKYVDDCHVINIVYSNILDKWIWVDPTFNAYVMDEKDNLLGIEEVRKRLIEGSFLKINEEANWNNKKKETKEHYLDYYMTKNLYKLECNLYSGYNIETQKENKPSPRTIVLCPTNSSEIKEASIDATDNVEYFWQSPEK